VQLIISITLLIAIKIYYQYAALINEEFITQNKW